MENILIFSAVIFFGSYIGWTLDHYHTNKKYPISYVVSAINTVALASCLITLGNYERPCPKEPEKLMKITITKSGVSASTIEPLDVQKIINLRDSSDIKIELVK
jgi:hypothetical protein